MPDLVRRNFRRYDRDNGQAGIVAPTHGLGSNSAIVVTASRGYIARFTPSRPMTITSISFVLTTASSTDDACDVGIFSGDLATKLVSAGATSGKLNGTLGLQTIPVTATTLAAGQVYYAAFSIGTIGGTVPQFAMSSFASTGMAVAFGATAGLIEQGHQSSAHPLAAPFTPVSTGIASVPILILRES